MTSPWPEFNERQFIRDWHNDVPVRDMGATYGISHTTVTYRAQKLGLPKRRDPRRPLIVGTLNPGSRYALRGGRWVYDPVRKVQVWEPWNT